MIQVGILGASGRMGTEVAKILAAEYSSRATLKVRATRENLGALAACDVVIDFSQPAAVLELIKVLQSIAPSDRPALAVGSTGWTPAERDTLKTLAKTTPVLMSSNFSTGVTSLLEILKTAAPLLKKLGYTPVIHETHHRHKKDAPSGTALSLQQAVEPYQPSSVQTHSTRAGEVIGDHEVVFYGPADRITFAHSAQDRSIFARGAIDVALWLVTQKGKPQEGLLGMDNYLKGLSQ